MRPGGIDLNGATQFEGRTAEEAVARARAVLGESGALRCWKTRRGGVGGFFAREIFVASLTPPPGSEATRGRASRAEPGPARAGPDDAMARGGSFTPDGVAQVGAEGLGPNGGPRPELGDESRDPDDLLSGLVEATTDQVSLRSLPIPVDAFDQVLAEAEAALAHDPEESGVTLPPPSATSTPLNVPPEPLAAPEAQRDSADNGKTDDRPEDRGSATISSRPKAPTGAARATAGQARPKPKPKAGRKPPPGRPTTVAEPERRARPARLPDLRPALRSLGVPSSYLPRGRRPSLDQLAGVMGTLPLPPALPTVTGAVVAVVGSGPDLERTVDVVAAELSLGPRDVLRLGGSAGDAPQRPTDPTRAAGRRLGRQIGRRRASGRASLVAVHAGPGMPSTRGARHLLEEAAPDYVLAAVGARCKREDVEHFVGALPGVDALALWDLSGTRTPGELLGVLPIAFVDGEASSPLGWTLDLARMAMDRGR